MMDTSITAYIHSKQKFSLHLLIQAYTRLCMIQINQGYVSLENVLECVQLASPKNASDIWQAHAALIYEGALVSSVLSATNQIPVLKIPPHILTNEGNFIRELMEVIYHRSEGISSPSSEFFQAEAVAFLKQASFKQMQNYQRPPPPQQQQQPELQFASYHQQTTPTPAFQPSNQAALSLTYMQPSKQPDRGNFSYQRPTYHSNNNALYAQSFSGSSGGNSDLEFERSDAVTRLLAQVRKNGMDILFPQLTHDMVLATILVSVQLAVIPIHREVIDMIVAIKDSNLFPGFENVSKTKIRGVLALLKHSELLLTEGNEGEPVRLFFPPFIHSYEDLRKAHDSFLVKYMLENNVYIPSTLKEKILWFHEDTTPKSNRDVAVVSTDRQQKLQSLNHCVQEMKKFILASYQSRNVNNPQYAGLAIGTTNSSVNSSNKVQGSPNSNASPAGSIEDHSCTTANSEGKKGTMALPPGLLTVQPRATSETEKPSSDTPSSLVFGDFNAINISSRNPSSSSSCQSSRPSAEFRGSLVIEPPQNPLISGTASAKTSNISLTSNSTNSLAALFPLADGFSLESEQSRLEAVSFHQLRPGSRTGLDTYLQCEQFDYANRTSFQSSEGGNLYHNSTYTENSRSPFDFASVQKKNGNRGTHSPYPQQQPQKQWREYSNIPRYHSHSPQPVSYSQPPNSSVVPLARNFNERNDHFGTVPQRFPTNNMNNTWSDLTYSSANQYNQTLVQGSKAVANSHFPANSARLSVPPTWQQQQQQKQQLKLQQQQFDEQYTSPRVGGMFDPKFPSY